MSNYTLRQSFFTEDDNSVQIGNLTINSTMMSFGVGFPLYANGSTGQAGQVLFSDGTSPYWDYAGSNVVGNTGIISNSSGLFFDQTIAYTLPALQTFTNVVISALQANGSFGSDGQVLTSNGSTIHWGSIVGAAGGTVTNVASGNGLTGGPISTSGTLSVLANSGVIANSTGVFVNTAFIGTLAANSATYVLANSGIVSNSTGVFVNSAFIGTLASNSATYVLANSGIISNSTGVFVNTAFIGTLASNSATYVLANSGIVSNSTGVFVNANTGLTANSTGVFVNAAYVQNTDTRTLSGNLTFSGQSTFSGVSSFSANASFSLISKYAVGIVALGTGNNFNCNCSAGNYFTMTCNNASSNIYFTNAPTGAFACVLKIANAATLTFANTPKWPAATQPTATANTDIWVFITDDSGTTWRGNQSMADSR